MKSKYLKIDTIGRGRGSLGLCITYEYYKKGCYDLYLFVNFFKWTMVVGKLVDFS
jgi:hypothetical protein